MNARAGQAALRGRRAGLCLAALLLTVPWCVRAQAQGAGEEPPAAQSASVSANVDPQAPGRREVLALPTIFFTPGQRHERELAEASALSSTAAPSTRPSSVRFSGWLSGHGKTHTWINGTAQAAGARTGGEFATFDPESKRLVVTDARGHKVRLRAGESLDQESVISLEPPVDTARARVSAEETVPPNAEARARTERP